MSDEIDVALDLNGETVPVGAAYFDRRRRATTTTLVYSSDYLGNRDAYAVDPALPMEAGRASLLVYRDRFLIAHPTGGVDD